jgi:hypothetical protein
VDQEHVHSAETHFDLSIAGPLVLELNGGGQFISLGSVGIGSQAEPIDPFGASKPKDQNDEPYEIHSGTVHNAGRMIQKELEEFKDEGAWGARLSLAR